MCLYIHKKKVGFLHAGICDITKRGANHSPVCKHHGNVENWNLQHKERSLRESCSSSGGAALHLSNMYECAVLGCRPEPGASVHHLPRNSLLKQKWMDFIYKHRLNRPSNTVGIRICCAHFSDDCFENFFQRSMGFAKKLILKPGAVPCIYHGNSNELNHVSI